MCEYLNALVTAMNGYASIQSHVNIELTLRPQEVTLKQHGMLTKR